MPEIVNIAGYKFVALDQLKELRYTLMDACREREVKGTILISEEGINLFLAASREQIDSFLGVLRAMPPFQDFHVKESPGDRQPFNRLLVRLKQEIIAFGVDGIDPANRTSPKLKPAELKQWLDEGKPVTLLDVRNNYEVELGTFKNAVVADIDHFRQFPDAIDRMNSLNKQAPVVMFCTGGIRCEKAGPFMENAGYESIYQLDGGILQYFEDCGGEHYDGDCFVFDQRVAVNPELMETDAEVCFACQAVLLPEQLQSEQYVSGVSCPVCYKTDQQKTEMLIEQRNLQFQNASTPLPGSVPYDNYRPMNVPKRFDGSALLKFLHEFHPHIPADLWLEKIESGNLLFNQRSLSAGDKVKAGQRLEHLVPSTVEPAVNNAIELIHEDDSLVVVRKPAPLPMHPSGRFNRNTLTWILSSIYDHQLRVSHRLDANTTGVIVFSRTRKVASIVQPQFENQTVNKCYLALVHGLPEKDEFVVDVPIADQPSWAGGRRIDSTGKQSVTKFRVIHRAPATSQSLLEVQPGSGRTNQIRIHLWHASHSIVGDPMYLKEQRMGSKQTLEIGDPCMCLHAWRIGLVHPESNKDVEYSARLPEWASDLPIC